MNSSNDILHCSCEQTRMYSIKLIQYRFSMMYHVSSLQVLWTPTLLVKSWNTSRVYSFKARPVSSHMLGEVATKKYSPPLKYSQNSLMSHLWQLMHSLPK
jgi:hypothetical protein